MMNLTSAAYKGTWDWQQIIRGNTDESINLLRWTRRPKRHLPKLWPRKKQFAMQAYFLVGSLDLWTRKELRFLLNVWNG